jgi:tetratricopeptide (TPR) repeat protein
MKRRLIVASFIAILSLVGGFLLVPRQDEYVAMLARDGHYQQALDMLFSIHEVGDRRPETLMQELVLRTKLGDIAGGLEAAEAFLAVRPGDQGAQQILADLLLSSGRLDEHMRVIDRMVRSSPSPQRLSHLLALYRHHGRYDAELALLQTFAGSHQLKLSDYERLGALLSARGDWQGAARWLQLVEREASSSGESSVRLRLLHVMLEGHRVNEAQRLAEVWLTRSRDAHLAGQLIIRFAQAGAGRAAMAIARVCAERMPDATFQVAGVLTQSSHAAISRVLLARWADSAAEPSAQDARSYIHASLAAGERHKPLQKLLQLINAKARPEVQAGFAEEIAYGYGPETLAQLLHLLPGEALRARPLLAAQIMRSGGNRQLAEWYLDRVDPSRLASHQQTVWLSLLRELKPPPLVLDRLIALRKNGRMPPGLADFLADEATAEGISELQDAVWARVGR